MLKGGMNCEKTSRQIFPVGLEYCLLPKTSWVYAASVGWKSWNQPHAYGQCWSAKRGLSVVFGQAVWYCRCSGSITKPIVRNALLNETIEPRTIHKKSKSKRTYHLNRRCARFLIQQNALFLKKSTTVPLLVSANYILINFSSFWWYPPRKMNEYNHSPYMIKSAYMRKNA